MTSGICNARRLAGAGIYIFPVDAQTKRPLPGFRWSKESTNNLMLVDELWANCPEAGVAIDLRRSRLVVIDADRHGGPDGVDAFGELTRRNRGLPTCTPRILTAGSGEHFYFKNTNPPLGNSSGSLPAGIDVRGAGGYVIAPGTIRPDGSGWIPAAGSPDLAEAYATDNIPALPYWLEQTIRAPRNGEAGGDPAGTKTKRNNANDGRGPTDAAPNKANYREYIYASAALKSECAELAATAAGGRNKRLNIAALKTGHFVGAGWISRADVEDALFRAAIDCRLVADDGERAVRATIKSGLDAGAKTPHAPLKDNDEDKHAKPKDDASGSKAEFGERINATPFEWVNPASIPPRDWLYGRHYIRKFISTTLAPGGVGKSSLVIAEAASMVSGRALLRVVPEKRLRVWLWNGEDPSEEMQRRITATALNYKLVPEDLTGLFVDSGRDQPLVLVEQTKEGTRIATPIFDGVIKTIAENAIDVVVVDPFVASHRVSENDNNAIETVAKTWAKIADAANCAVELVHHTRKTGGGEATVEDARGASALVAAARSARVLNGMTEAESEAADVDNRRRFFRVDDGKGNLALPADVASWFEVVSVNLGNGDSVGVVSAWDMPNVLDDVSVHDLRAAQKAVAAGGPWREHSQAKEWVGIPIGEVLGLDPAKKAHKRRIASVLAIWVKTGMFVVYEGKDARRMPKKFVRVGEPAND